MPAGRPSAMTPEVIRKLEEAFLLGCSDHEACFYADIAPSTLYKYQLENPEFTERKEALKSNPVFLARKVIVNALHNDDVQTAHKVIERKEGAKLAITGADGGPIKTESTVQFIGVNANSD